MSREDFLYALVHSYAAADYANQVWGRESSTAYISSKGKLIGALMVLELDIEESASVIEIVTRKRRKKVLVFEKTNVGLQEEE